VSAEHARCSEALSAGHGLDESTELALWPSGCLAFHRAGCSIDRCRPQQQSVAQSARLETRRFRQLHTSAVVRQRYPLDYHCEVAVFVVLTQPWDGLLAVVRPVVVAYPPAGCAGASSRFPLSTAVSSSTKEDVLDFSFLRVLTTVQYAACAIEPRGFLVH